MNVYLVHFHHGVESVAVRADTYEQVEAAFAEHQDWAVEEIELVRRATEADRVNVPLYSTFS
jgi:hypothetical protein